MESICAVLLSDDHTLYGQAVTQHSTFLLSSCIIGSVAKRVWLGMWDTEWVRAVVVHIGYR